MPSGNASPLSYLLPIGVAAVVIILRNSRPRRLRIELLWIYPAVYLALMALFLVVAPPPITPVSLGVLVAGFAIGAAIGWQRGRFTRLDIHPETHDLTAQASPIGLVFIFAVLAVRYAARDYLQAEAIQLGLPVVALLDAFLVLAVAMLAVQRLELWLRASKLLAEAQAARGLSAPPEL